MKIYLNKSILRKGFTVSLMVVLSACQISRSPAPTIAPDVFYTQAAATIMFYLSQTIQPKPSQTPIPSTTSLIPSVTPISGLAAPALETASLTRSAPPAFPSATSIIIDPSTAHGCYNATFISDVTIQYSPIFIPGSHFTKTWKILNSGSCDWSRNIQIIFAGGDRFGADSTVIDQKVAAGEMANISLNMIAPQMTGLVTSTWQLATETGKPFGPVLSVVINLLENPDATLAMGCLNSALIKDVTIPPGTEVTPGANFTKTWRLKNTGSCTWTKNFKITHIGDETFGVIAGLIGQAVAPGNNIEISLDMTAPGSPGIFSSAWQLATDDNRLFGQLFAFSIVVR